VVSAHTRFPEQVIQTHASYPGMCLHLPPLSPQGKCANKLFGNGKKVQKKLSLQQDGHTQIGNLNTCFLSRLTPYHLSPQGKCVKKLFGNGEKVGKMLSL